jgi:uncharacterized protein involved in exopolysaccharide biosynthesis
MSIKPHSISEPRELAGLLVVYWRRWAIPAVLITAAAAAYTVAAPKTWQASQALIVRNEAAAGDTSPGKFRGIEEMKGIQETIQELARSRSVLEDALRAVGPAADEPADESAGGSWPTPQAVETLRQNVTISPPKGAAFGATEVFYVELRDHDRLRAVAVNRAICDRLQAKFQDLRDAKARSMIEELNKAVRLAKADLMESTGRLSAVEKSVGSDLAELRMLHDGSAADGMLRHKLTEIEGELRQVRAAEKSNRQLLGALRPAENDAGALLAAPSRLLESQPALKRLKDGLVDAQLRTAQLQGQMSAEHPLVVAAKEAERETAERLHNELAVAIRGLEAELQFNADRASMLEKQAAEASRRLARLAEIRADYSNQVAETGQRSKLVERAEQNLAEARATLASAKAASLINCIDSPDTGARPVSPSTAVVILAGVLGGLLTGLGIVFLTVPPPQASQTAQTSQVAHDAPAAPAETAKPTRRNTECKPAAAVNPAAVNPAPALPRTRNLSVKEALRRVSPWYHV